MDEFDRLFKTINDRLAAATPVIACLYTAQSFPSYCEAMLRDPAPKLGSTLGENFASEWSDAVALNPSVHDGAVMCGRLTRHAPYFVTGWSFRLFPGSLSVDLQPNRGSAFNSCLAMSGVPSVDCVYLTSQRALFKFIRGRSVPF